jgi:hypothetical protein
MIKQFEDGIELSGYITGMPEDYYHNTKGLISKSSLASLGKETPYRFFNGKKKQPTAAMKMGTALHCAVLEPEKFEASYKLMPEIKAKTLKAYKDAVKENPEMEILNGTDAKNLVGMLDAVSKHSAPSDFSRLLFVYTASDKRLKYFIGDPSTGSYAQRGNLAIPQTMVDGQNITGGLCIGKKWAGQGGSGFSGVNWHGGLNNLIVSNIAFTGPHLVEYFQTGEEFTSMELYSDVVAYAKLGEDTFPNVTDEKGLLTGGQLVNGTEADFKDIPSE